MQHIALQSFTSGFTLSHGVSAQTGCQPDGVGAPCLQSTIVCDSNLQMSRAAPPDPPAPAEF